MTKPIWEQSQEIPGWVIQETEKKRKPRPRQPDVPTRLKVQIELRGYMELNLEGPEADPLKVLLLGGDHEGIWNFLDPWASGVEARYIATITEPTGRQWVIDEHANPLS